MANSKLKCTNCGGRFPAGDMQKTPAGNFHTFDCLMEYANKGKAKAQKKLAAKAKADTRVKEKAARAKHKAAKERVKSKSKWLSELQSLVNKYVRLRDAKEGCISCDKPATWSGQWHASHYYSRGHSSSLRFNLWNIHKSCSVCNSHLSGNIGEYTPRLIEKIGQGKYDQLERHKSDIANYDIEWIKRAIKVARKGIKRIESRR